MMLLQSLLDLLRYLSHRCLLLIRTIGPLVMMLTYGWLDPLKVIVELLLLYILVRCSSDFND